MNEASSGLAGTGVIFLFVALVVSGLAPMAESDASERLAFRVAATSFAISAASFLGAVWTGAFA